MEGNDLEIIIVKSCMNTLLNRSIEVCDSKHSKHSTYWQIHIKSNRKRHIKKILTENERTGGWRKTVIHDSLYFLCIIFYIFFVGFDSYSQVKETIMDYSIIRQNGYVASTFLEVDKL